MSDTTPAIYELLAKAIAEVPAVPKDKRGSGINYSYRGIDATLEAVKPVLDRHGIVCVPAKVKILQREQIKTAKGSLVWYTTVGVTWRFVAASDGSSFECYSIGEAQDHGDKSFAKAQSVAQRVVYEKTFSLVCEEPEAPAEEMAPANGNGKPARDAMLAEILATIASRCPDSEPGWKEARKSLAKEAFGVDEWAKVQKLSADKLRTGLAKLCAPEVNP